MDFRCAFFKGAIATDMTILLLCRLFKGIAAPSARNVNEKISRGASRRGNCLYSVPSQFSFKSFADGAVEEAKYYHNHAYYKRYYRAGRNAYA